VKDGALSYEYNLFLITRTTISAKDKLPTGKVKIEVETRYAVPRPAGPLDITMKVNGNVVATGRVPVSAPLLFTANDCLDIGTDLGSPVSLEYYDQAPFAFNGTISQVHVKYTSAQSEEPAIVPGD
jgi:arylsulfatase